MIPEKYYLVKLLPSDFDSCDEVFGIFSDIERVEIAMKQFSIEIEVDIVENVHYEISEIELNKSNYLLNK
jgi:hypothetical protein